MKLKQTFSLKLLLLIITALAVILALDRTIESRAFQMVIQANPNWVSADSSSRFSNTYSEITSVWDRLCLQRRFFVRYGIGMPNSNVTQFYDEEILVRLVGAAKTVQKQEMLTVYD